MPQPLRRKRPPIDWSPAAVANHPILSSGVGASITAFASLEAALGAYLILIRWQHTEDLVDRWKRQRNTKDKRALVEFETEGVPNTGLRDITVDVLDRYTSLAKRRAKLAHGFFGIITDRESEFAWRPSEAAAQKASMGLTASLGEELPDLKTWVYTPRDFEELATQCAELYARLGLMFNLIPVVYGAMDRSPDDGPS